ncbi:MAG: FAD:protein FMN transferase [Chitinophagaceae bacterium]|nr:MAG: FAD:protein FMN transferase [Chitinophagaceae bacterium]
MSQKLMGNNFEFTIVDQSKENADSKFAMAINEISRIEALLSTYRHDSVTNHINLMAGVAPVEVPREVYDLISRSLKISEITDGAFDITYGSIDKSLWNFDRSMKSLPDKETARQGVKLINYRNVILDSSKCTVMLKHKGMRIGFGGIGKGYAAEKARSLLKSTGVKAGIINASGDIATWGMRADGTPWTVGIAHPDVAGLPFSSLEVTESAVATSGNYEKYVIIDGKKYSHTINPKTGLPVSGIKSVTIICSNAEIADALATPVTIMGTKEGIELVNQLAGIECIIIDDNNKIHKSKNIKLR